MSNLTISRIDFILEELAAGRISKINAAVLIRNILAHV